MVHIKIGAETIEIAWDDWEERVRSGRVPEDALIRFEPVTGDRWLRAGDLESYRSLRTDAAIAWRRAFLYGPPPIATALLVGFQIRVFLVAQIPVCRTFWSASSPTGCRRRSATGRCGAR